VSGFAELDGGELKITDATLALGNPPPIPPIRATSSPRWPKFTPSARKRLAGVFRFASGPR